ncbi:MAG: DUF3050 domain-containing protein [Candidatus Sericytochromatia bacterium]|nr:DUF3050 domain-containing protein [Candidatus Sericytochromatia bacterium]
MTQQDLEALTVAYRQQISAHPLYASLHTLADVQVFMQHHVFAVWDFMTLLKALQLRFTGSQLPWLPAADNDTCRLINEIVLAEESDCLADGSYCSHFELYHRAMRACGADTRAIDAFLAALRAGAALPDVLQAQRLPAGAAAFVEETWRLATGPSHAALAAAFCLGREAIIPDLFRGLVARLHQEHAELAIFVDYLERHIHLDGETHGPMAWQMLSQICAAEPEGWANAYQGAQRALAARRQLWDQIQAGLQAPVPVLSG